MKFTVAESNKLFYEFFPLIEQLIARRCYSDESRQNAMCWAWFRFQHYLEGAETPKQAAIVSAIYGAKMRRIFGKPPRSGYIDAMSRRGDGHYAADSATSPADQSDQTAAVGFRIEEMPPDLQMVALCIGAGHSRKETAELIGTSVETVRRRCDRMVRWILDRTGKSPLDRRMAA